MYGKKRIVLEKNHHWVFQKGGKSSHCIGFWYQDEDKFYADLKSPDQEWSMVKRAELGNQRFGGFSRVSELRKAVAVLRGVM